MSVGSDSFVTRGKDTEFPRYRCDHIYDQGDSGPYGLNRGLAACMAIFYTDRTRIEGFGQSALAGCRQAPDRFNSLFTAATILQHTPEMQALQGMSERMSWHGSIHERQ